MTCIIQWFKWKRSWYFAEQKTPKIGPDHLLLECSYTHKFMAFRIQNSGWFMFVAGILSSQGLIKTWWVQHWLPQNVGWWLPPEVNWDRRVLPLTRLYLIVHEALCVFTPNNDHYSLRKWPLIRIIITFNLLISRSSAVLHFLHQRTNIKISGRSFLSHDRKCPYLQQRFTMTNRQTVSAFNECHFVSFFTFDNIFKWLTLVSLINILAY